jgi:hypothetical protein
VIAVTFEEAREIARKHRDATVRRGEVEGGYVLVMDSGKIYDSAWKAEFVLRVAAKSNEDAIASHREFLERRGIRYEGVRVTTKRRLHRKTHCYSCMRPLDNDIDVECNICGWIICSCGACGCGWSGGIGSEFDEEYYNGGSEEVDTDQEQLREELSEEISSSEDDWDRSNEEGWFYED